MKRVAAILVACGLVLGAYSGAHAADIKAKGVWAIDFSWLDSGDYTSMADDGKSDDDFSASQRLRTQIDIIASDSLRGVVFFEMAIPCGAVVPTTTVAPSVPTRPISKSVVRTSTG